MEKNRRRWMIMTAVVVAAGLMLLTGYKRPDTGHKKGAKEAPRTEAVETAKFSEPSVQNAPLPKDSAAAPAAPAEDGAGKWKSDLPKGWDTPTKIEPGAVPLENIKAPYRSLPGRRLLLTPDPVIDSKKTAPAKSKAANKHSKQPPKPEPAKQTGD